MTYPSGEIKTNKKSTRLYNGRIIFGDTSLYLLFVEFWLSVVASLCEWVSVFVPVECEEADRKPQGVQHLVFDRRQQNVQLLRLRRYGTRAQVGVPSYGPAKNQTDADKISG